MRKVGEILKEERERRGLTLTDVQKALKIRRELLLAIEAGRYHELPSQSYAIGFVKNYASYLRLSPDKISAFFRREYKEEKREVVPEFRLNQNQFHKKSLFSSINISIVLIAICVVGYIIFQFGTLFIGPSLVIEKPKNGENITESVITINGKTDQYAIVLIDGEEAVVGIDGSFKKTMYVIPGEKNIEVIAKNKFGKETKKQVQVTIK